MYDVTNRENPRLEIFTRFGLLTVLLQIGGEPIPSADGPLVLEPPFRRGNLLVADDLSPSQEQATNFSAISATKFSDLSNIPVFRLVRETNLQRLGRAETSSGRVLESKAESIVDSDQRRPLFLESWRLEQRGRKTKFSHKPRPS